MKRIILFILASLLIAACSDGYTVIKGEAPEFEGKTVYLYTQELGAGDLQPDSTVVLKGLFSFKREYTAPSEGWIYIPAENINESIYVFLSLDQGIITVVVRSSEDVIVSGTRTTRTFRHSRLLGQKKVMN